MSFPVRFATTVAAASLMAACATGCTSLSANPTGAKSVTPPATKILPGGGGHSPAAICGQFSAFFTIEHNAVTAAKKGTITTAVEGSLLSSILPGMEHASSTNARVQGAQIVLDNALTIPNTTAPGLPYDPAATAYRAAQHDLAAACIAAGTKITEYDNTGA